MSRYFPHTSYAEDQPLARTILTTHVATRAVTTGTIIGVGIIGAQLFRKTTPPNTVGMPRSQLYLRQAGVSTLWTIGVVTVGLIGRMWGREEIEWKDRSWRLMESKGQLETDDWTYGGMAAGLAGVILLKRPVGGVVMLGSIGVGSVAGALGYMGWRYGVHGGKHPDEKS